MTDRTIRVVEVRVAPIDGGPWGDPEVFRQGLEHDSFGEEWSSPTVAMRLVRDESGLNYRQVPAQYRVIPYVPASELERYRAVVESAINWNAGRGAFGDVVFAELVAQGFINPDGTRKP